MTGTNLDAELDARIDAHFDEQVRFLQELVRVDPGVEFGVEIGAGH